MATRTISILPSGTCWNISNTHYPKLINVPTQAKCPNDQSSTSILDPSPLNTSQLQRHRSYYGLLIFEQYTDNCLTHPYYSAPKVKVSITQHQKNCKFLLTLMRFTYLATLAGMPQVRFRVHPYQAAWFIMWSSPLENKCCWTQQTTLPSVISRPYQLASLLP